MARKTELKKTDGAKAPGKKIRVTLVRSIFGQLAMHRNNVRGLGLTRMHQSRELVATPEVMGMVRGSQFMLKVEEV